MVKGIQSSNPSVLVACPSKQAEKNSNVCSKLEDRRFPPVKLDEVSRLHLGPSDRIPLEWTCSLRNTVANGGWTVMDLCLLPRCTCVTCVDSLVIFGCLKV